MRGEVEREPPAEQQRAVHHQHPSPGERSPSWLRVARSVTGSHKSGSTRPVPPGSTGPNTSRHSAPVSNQPA